MIPRGTRILRGRTRVLYGGRPGLVVDVLNAERRPLGNGAARVEVPARLVVALDAPVEVAGPAGRPGQLWQVTVPLQSADLELDEAA